MAHFVQSSEDVFTIAFRAVALAILNATAPALRITVFVSVLVSVLVSVPEQAKLQIETAQISVRTFFITISNFMRCRWLVPI